MFCDVIPQNVMKWNAMSWNVRAVVITRFLVHKHVKINMNEWILETFHPHEHVQFLRTEIIQAW